MAIQWNFKDKMGEMTMERKGKKYQINIYKGNCLAVFLSEYQNEKGEDMYSLYSFFADEQHLKRMIKNKIDMFGDKMLKIKLNFKYKEAQKIITIAGENWSKNGTKINIYNK